MSIAKVEVRLLGFEALRDDLREVYKSLTQSKKPVMERIAARVADIIRRRLQSESGRKPLDPDTITRRKYGGGGGDTPLVSTGAMLASVTSEGGEDYATAGPGSDYAPFVQYGFRHVGGRKVPGRPFVWLDQRDQEEAMDTLEEYLFGAAG